MKSPLRVTLQIGAVFVLFVGAVFLGRSLPQPTRAAAAALEPANAAKPLAAGTEVSCTIYRTAAFSYPDPGRIHVQCSNAPVPGVYFFAFKGDDSATASRILSIFNTAFAMGKPLLVWYLNEDGSSWGCGYADCRPIQGAAVGP